jgi:hypothetical protein
MSARKIYEWGIPGILAILLMCTTTVAADPVPSLTGDWEGIFVDQYTPSDGFVDRMNDQGPYHIIKQDGRAFAGDVTYYDSQIQANVTELFAGVLSPDGLTFVIDEEGSGITFGELVSDHELYNYMLFSDRGPMVIVSHMVKAGTAVAPEKPVPNLTGVWNLTHNRSNSMSNPGIITITEQQGRIWSGNEQIRDKDDLIIEVPMVGTIGDTGRLYAVSQDGAYMFGSMTGDETIESVFVIPGDDEGNFVVEQWMTRNEPPILKSDSSYPDIAGDWKIDDRKIIQDGNITSIGPVDTEWMSYANQTGTFVTATRHTQDLEGSSELESSMIFLTPELAYLTNEDSAFVMYHILDDSTIEAVVNQKDGKAMLYLDVLKRN